MGVRVVFVRVNYMDLWHHMFGEKFTIRADRILDFSESKGRLAAQRSVHLEALHAEAQHSIFTARFGIRSSDGSLSIANYRGEGG